VISIQQQLLQARDVQEFRTRLFSLVKICDLKWTRV
jgi:hypothetical protein